MLINLPSRGYCKVMDILRPVSFFLRNAGDNNNTSSNLYLNSGRQTQPEHPQLVLFRIQRRAGHEKSRQEVLVGIVTDRAEAQTGFVGITVFYDIVTPAWFMEPVYVICGFRKDWYRCYRLPLSCFLRANPGDTILSYRLTRVSESGRRLALVSDSPASAFEGFRDLERTLPGVGSNLCNIHLIFNQEVGSF